MSSHNRGNLMPHLLGPDYWDLFDFPSSVDHDFGDILDPFEVFEPFSIGGGLPPLTQLQQRQNAFSRFRPRPLDWQTQQRLFGQQRPIGSDRHQLQSMMRQTQPQVGVSQVENDAEKFCVGLDCRHFNPDEVKVEFGDKNTILIQGKHDERTDEHGYVSREFKRRYALPSNCDLEQVQANWTENGKLCIVCPKKPPVQKGLEVGTGKAIPIQGAELYGQRGQRQPILREAHQQYYPSQQQQLVGQEGASQPIFSQGPQQQERYAKLWPQQQGQQEQLSKQQVGVGQSIPIHQGQQQQETEGNAPEKIDHKIEVNETINVDRDAEKKKESEHKEKSKTTKEGKKDEGVMDKLGKAIRG